MIYHNAKRNGFTSGIVDEKYIPDVARIYTAHNGKSKVEHAQHEVYVTYDMFGSSLALRLEDEIYVIDINKIIEDILEVEHENENFFSDH